MRCVSDLKAFFGTCEEARKYECIDADQFLVSAVTAHHGESLDVLSEVYADGCWMPWQNT